MERLYHPLIWRWKKVTRIYIPIWKDYTPLRGSFEAYPRYLHSNMERLYQDMMNTAKVTRYIYIPIWKDYTSWLPGFLAASFHLHSNMERLYHHTLFNSDYYIIFTFQYGKIIHLLFICLSISIVEFTFQYGKIIPISSPLA